MKKYILIYIPAIVISLIIAWTCDNNNNQKDYITIDLSKEYKKLVLPINEMVSVRYVPLYTDSIFLINNNPIIYVGNKYIISADNITGNILCFDKKGKKISHINRRGQGPEEYLYIGNILFDDKESYIYIWSIFDYAIKIYDINGDFKKKITLSKEKGSSANILSMSLMNNQDLLCSIRSLKGNESYLIYELQKGTKPFLLYEVKAKKNINIYIQTMTDRGIKSAAPNLNLFSSFNNDIYISIPSNDTIFKYNKKEMSPIMIIRGRESNGSKIIVELLYQSDNFYFLKSTLLKYDFKNEAGFPNKYYRINKSTGNINEIKFINPDYKKQDIKSLNQPKYISAKELMNAIEYNQLRGNLKSIATEIKEEDNGIIMYFEQK